MRRLERLRLYRAQLAANRALELERLREAHAEHIARHGDNPAQSCLEF